MKRPYFQKISVHINNQITEIIHIKNIAEGYIDGIYNNKYYYLIFDESNTFYRLFETNGFGNDDVQKTGTNISSGVFASTSFVIRQFGINFRGGVTFGKIDPVGLILLQYYSNDGGATWLYQANVYLSVDIDDKANIIDIVKIGSDYFYIYELYDDSASACYVKALKYGTSTIYDLITLKSSGASDYSNYCFGGNVKSDGEYHFLYYEGTNFKVAKFDGTTTTAVKTITDFSVPSSFSHENQLYWIKGDIEFCMMTNRLYWYQNSTSTWLNYYISVFSGINMVFWDKNYLDEYIIPGFAWGNAIWKITSKGTLKKIQALEPRDYKKVYLTNKNENLTGVVQFQDRNGNDDLSAWTDSSGADCEVSIVDLIDGHKNVMELDDQSAVNGFSISLIFTTQTSGFIELYINGEDVLKPLYVYIYSGGTIAFRVRISGDKIQYYYTAAWHDATGGGVLDNTTYHWKITFDTVADTYIFNLNGNQLDADIPFENIVANITKIEFLSSGGTTGYKYYIDAIGFSWDSYVSGSNKKINAYVGYGSDIDEAWFSTGDADTSIMQLSLKDYSSGTSKSLVVSEIYKSPACSLIRRTPPFEDEWIDLYTNVGKLFYGGKVKDNNNDNRFLWILLMKSWEDEYKKTKITANLVGYNHGDMLKYVIDNFSKYLWYGAGTNGDVDDFVSGLTGWTNNDGVDCESSYVAKKGFLNGFMYDILQQYDNSAVNECDIYKTITGSLVLSEWMTSSDTMKLFKFIFYEGANFIGQIHFQNGKLYWYDTASRELMNVSNNIMYHIALVFSATDDDVDIYINGIFNSTQNLAAVGLTININKIEYKSFITHTAYYAYHSRLYYGNSLVDAMHTYCSISPLLTTTYDFKLKSDSHPGIQKLIAEETGYIVSVRPSGQVYLDQYGASGITIDRDASQGITFISRMQIRNEKFSKIIFYGGFYNGIQITAEGFGEPNFGSYEDWFPMIDGREVGDIYYDSDGNPKSHRLDSLITTAIANRNIVIKKQILGKRGVGMIKVGTSLTYNNSYYKISSETWNAWRRNTYNGITDDNRVEIADSYLSPTKADPEDSKEDQMDANIGENSDNIVKNEQNIGAVEEKTSWTWRDPTTADFTDDGVGGTALTDALGWNDLDISAIVGAKKMLIVLWVKAQDNVSGSAIGFREKGFTSSFCVCTAYSAVASKDVPAMWMGETDDDGIIQINSDPKPTDWTQIDIVIRGYRNA